MGTEASADESVVSPVVPEMHRQVVSILGWMDDATFANLSAKAQAGRTGRLRRSARLPTDMVACAENPV
jgi:hypothetical protein